MSQVPNPGRFVALSKAQLNKKGLFLSAKKIKQIRALPQNSFTLLMRSQLNDLVKNWLLNEIEFDSAKYLSRKDFGGYLEASFLFLLNEDKNLEKEIKKRIKLLLNSVHKINENPLDLCHLLIALSLLYHWVPSSLSQKQKKQIEQVVQKYASSLYSQTKTPLGYWSGTPLHNITHCAWCGIGVAGFAFSHILLEAKFWLNDAFHYFNLVSWLQAEDGSLIEGPSYSAYETEMRAIFYYLSKDLLGENLYRENHLGVADYFTHLHKPSGIRNNHIFPWGDSGKGLMYHSPNNLLLSLASEFKSKDIQSKVYHILKKGFTSSAGCEWMNLIFYNPKVSYEENFKTKTDHKFHDLGLIVSRNSWKEDASAITFKCGPYQGFRARKDFNGDPGGSHCHADSASLQLYGKQADLLIDPGYETLKRTSHHNTIMINGFGQLGEGSKWYGVNHALHYDHCGEILFYQANKQYACWMADATKAYVPEANLKQYLRAVIFIKPNILLVLDEIETTIKSKFKILWHTPLKKVSGDTSSVLFQNEKASLLLNAFTEKNSVQINTKKRFYDELVTPAHHTISTITNKIKSQKFVCLSAFTIGEPNEKHKVKITYANNVIKILNQNISYTVKIKKDTKNKILVGLS